MSDQRITVAVRIRPPLERERYEPVCARKADDDQTIIIKPEESAANMGEASAFQFDYVFDESDDQCAVYEESVQEMVDHALSGFNATVFTYGQTGSGKTYTILGSMSSDGSVSAQSGMFLRVFDDLFTYRTAVQKRLHIVITLSALELYVEEVMDLLANKNKLKLRETPEETLTMGINTVEVNTMADVVRNFQVANSFRSVTATKMNDTSSRSHALFFIDLFQIPVDQVAEVPPLSKLIDANGMPIPNAVPGLVRSRIALVDLAGSERVKRSGVTGQAMVEAQAINKSLSTLGTVINAMYVQSSHIPFRESKLTKLLKPSFVDTTSRLLLIGQVAPPTVSASESLGTLRFCDRVKGLKAGQVMGFSDPEEEQRFLASKKANEELVADLRIAEVECYFEPMNLRGLAVAKGVSCEQEKARVMQELQATAADHAARKEQEALAKMEQQVLLERDAEVEQFVLKMNSMIEEYDQVAREVKKEKKNAKKLKEERDAEQEARLHEAKKAKKLRLKSEEQVAALRAAVEEATAADEQVSEELSTLQQELAANAEAVKANTGNDDAVETATHGVVECFYNHATDLNRLYGLYVSRLAATARQRSMARRMKLMSSSLVTDGTLLYDIIDFLVDRAVDIAEGDVPMRTKWNWHDIDGMSGRLLGGPQLYPPLLTDPSEYTVSGQYGEPCHEQAHTVTFLSSDESDGENSHHAAESRSLLLKQKRRSRLQSAGGGYQPGDDDEEGEEDDEEEKGKGGGGGGGGREAETANRAQAVPPKRRKSDWMDGNMAVATPPPEAASQEDAGDGAKPKVKKDKKHKKAAVASDDDNDDDRDDSRGADSDHEALKPAGPAAAEHKKSKKEKRKSADGQLSSSNVTTPAPPLPPPPPQQEEENEVDTASSSASSSSGDSDNENGGPHHHDNGDARAAHGPRKKNKVQNAFDATPTKKKQAKEEADAVRKAKKTKKGGAASASSDDNDDSSEEEEGTSDGSDGAPPPVPGVHPTSAAGTSGAATEEEHDLTKEEEDQVYLMRVYDSPTLVQDLIKFLRGGTTMLKHGRQGKPHRRLFWVSLTRGKKELLWMNPNARDGDRSSIQLDEVSYIQLGCFSKVFKRYPIPPSDPAFYRSFTIGLKGGGRTVDIVADNVPDYEAWVVGLSSMVGVDAAWGGKLNVARDPDFGRLTFFEASLCETNYIPPRDYLRIKREVQRRTELTLRTLRECGNDVARASKILRGIHPPAVSDKNALYLTKGELRFLLPDVQIDIFRVARVWMLLQQMNLVFDPNFVPPTAFGVTRRE